MNGCQTNPTDQPTDQLPDHLWAEVFGVREQTDTGRPKEVSRRAQDPIIDPTFRM